MNNIEHKKIIKNMIFQLKEKTQDTQMTTEEYEYIASFLGDKNFLVFGTGYDSDLWRYANRQGKTIFLEHNTQWITNTEDTCQISYTCNLRKDKDRLLEEYKQGMFSNLIIDLPSEVTTTTWDLILVDSPEGGKKKHYHGRMQSIYAAKQLASLETDIFVHDCDRYVEDVYSSVMFSKLIKELTKLRHFKIK
jgi:uncharacterized protein (TIGR01627 family)